MATNVTAILSNSAGPLDSVCFRVRRKDGDFSLQDVANAVVVGLAAAMRIGLDAELFEARAAIAQAEAAGIKEA